MSTIFNPQIVITSHGGLLKERTAHRPEVPVPSEARDARGGIKRLRFEVEEKRGRVVVHYSKPKVTLNERSRQPQRVDNAQVRHIHPAMQFVQIPPASHDGNLSVMGVS